jgi:CheY-like chemotaxis protein
MITLTVSARQTTGGCYHNLLNKKIPHSLLSQRIEFHIFQYLTKQCTNLEVLGIPKSNNNERTLSSPSRKNRVLVIEDDLIIQKVHRAHLENLGFSVDTASNGKQALNIYKPNYYALIFLDAHLPDTTGFDIAKIIRNQETPGQHQVLIMLSGLRQEEIKEKLQETDIDEFLTKPISQNQFEELVKRWDTSK